MRKLFRLKTCLLAAMLLAVPVTASAQIAMATGDNLVTMKEPWARLTPMSGAIFGTLNLSGDVEDQLVSISCPDTAEHVELHFTSMEDGVMKMKAVETLALPPGLDVRMEPGGMHIMLMGLKEKKNPGDTITCTMTFEHAQDVTFSAAVRPLGKDSVE